MNDIVKQILFYIVILLTNIIQCITGFAGTVLAMPFSLMLVGYDVAKPILNVLGILASIGVIIFNYKSINLKEFLKIVLIMGSGMAIGILLIHYLDIDKQILYFILAGIILIFTIIGIYDNFIRKEENENNKESIRNNILLYSILVASGVVHGMFVCGGPLLVLYASRKLKSRDEFRATLSLSWTTLNTIILITDISQGYFRSEVLPNMMITLGISSVILVGAIIIGNIIAKKLERKPFLIITFILMAISAVSLILNACGVM